MPAPRRVFLHSAATLALLAPAGCEKVAAFFREPKPDVAKPKTHKSGDLSFDYPGNWTTSKSFDTLNGISIKTVTCESAGNALVMVQVFDAKIPINLDTVMKSFAEGMRDDVSKRLGGVAKLEELAKSKVEREIFGAKRKGRRMRFQISLLGEKTVTECDIFPAELPDRTVLVYASAPADDAARAKPAFDLVTKSLAMAPAKKGVGAAKGK